jgi:hypothetical protein
MSDPARVAPTRRGIACVVVHAAAFVAATAVGFARPHLPAGIARPLQAAVLVPAAVAGRRVDWAAHGWVDRLRYRLGTDDRFRAMTRALLDDATEALDERAGYVGTVRGPRPDVERRLAARGFRRNPTAYLNYRERTVREYERASWALRERVDAPRQLHVLLFDAPDGIDIYAHWEPSVLAGADHYGRPDYPAGVAMARQAVAEAGLALERRPLDGQRPPDPPAPTTPPRRPG